MKDTKQRVIDQLIAEGYLPDSAADAVESAWWVVERVIAIMMGEFSTPQKP